MIQSYVDIVVRVHVLHDKKFNPGTIAYAGRINLAHQGEVGRILSAKVMGIKKREVLTRCTEPSKSCPY